VADFERLRDKIGTPVAAAVSEGQDVGGRLPSFPLTRREKALQKLDHLLYSIRGLGDEDFKHPLEPPQIAQLKAAASGGPIVVINVSSQRSDVFIIRPDITELAETLPLPDLQMDPIEKQQKLLQSRKITRLSSHDPAELKDFPPCLPNQLITIGRKYATP
jgi:hypothetical protein